MLNINLDTDKFLKEESDKSSSFIRKIAKKISEEVFGEEIIGEEENTEISEIPGNILTALKGVGLNPDIIIEFMKSHGTASILLSGQMSYTVSLFDNLSKRLKSDFNISPKGNNLLLSSIKLV